MQRQDFRCFHRLRVRWAEVDIQKIVFNAHYLTYADCAMTDYWRALALPYETGMQALGGEVYLKKASVEYHASARLDDLLDVGMRCARVGHTSLLFECAMFAGDRLLFVDSEGTVHECYRKRGGVYKPGGVTRMEMELCQKRIRHPMKLPDQPAKVKRKPIGGVIDPSALAYDVHDLMIYNEKARKIGKPELTYGYWAEKGKPATP